VYNGRRKLRRALAISLRRVVRIGDRGILTTRRNEIVRGSQSATRLPIAPPTNETPLGNKNDLLQDAKRSAGEQHAG